MRPSSSLSLGLSDVCPRCTPGMRMCFPILPSGPTATAAAGVHCRGAPVPQSCRAIMFSSGGLLKFPQPPQEEQLSPLPPSQRGSSSQLPASTRLLPGSSSITWRHKSTPGGMKHHHNTPTSPPPDESWRRPRNHGGDLRSAPGG